MSWTITPASVDDLERILEIEAHSFEDPWPRQAFADELDNSNAHLELLGEAGGGEAVAFIDYWIVAGEAHLLNVAAHPDQRRQGLGRLLMDHLLNRAREASCTEVSLEVRPTNTPAVALYLAYGFKEAGRRPKYYPDGEDALIMVLRF